MSGVDGGEEKRVECFFSPTVGRLPCLLALLCFALLACLCCAHCLLFPCVV